MRLKILYVSQMPASPPRCGAQARVHGLMTEIAQKHDVSAVMLVDDEFDIDEARAAMKDYCKDLVLLPNPYSCRGLSKRMLQLRSMFAPESFERLRVSVPDVQAKLDDMLRSKSFDVVNLEFPYLGHLNLKQAPPGEKTPVLVVDSHEIAYDLGRQFANAEHSPLRRIYAQRNWPKLKEDELGAYGGADGVCLCSRDDQARLLEELPHVRTEVIPNAADVEYFQPRPGDPEPDGRTVAYFGLLSTVPNIDGVQHMVKDIWPGIAERHPDARLKIIGGRAPQSLLELAGPRIEFTGFVDDLRPHLASAAVLVVPLRLGGGTRLKIVEGMSMAKAIVSTSLGAEGIEAMNGHDILIADDPAEFANSVSRLLSNPELARDIGRAARQLAIDKYSWRGAARTLDRFYNRLLEART